MVRPDLPMVTATGTGCIATGTQVGTVAGTRTIHGTTYGGAAATAQAGAQAVDITTMAANQVATTQVAIADIVQVAQPILLAITEPAT